MNAFSASNPFLLSEDPGITPGGEIVVRPDLTWPIGPGTTATAEGSLGFRQYSRRYGNFVTGQATGTLQHRRSEYLWLRTDASYERILPTDALADSIDVAIDPVSLRENIQARQTLTWNPNETTSVVGSVAWLRTDAIDSPILIGTSAFDFSIGAEKRVSPLLAVGVRGQVITTRSELGDDPTIKAFRLTATRRLAGTWRAQASVGIDQENRTGLDSVRRETPARLSGSGGICYEPEHMAVCLTAAIRSVISGFGNLQRETSVGATLRRRISENGTLAASADYRRAPLPGVPGRAEVLQLSTDYEHRVSRRFSLRSGVDYLRRNLLAGDRAGSVVVHVGLTLREPRR